MIPILFLSSQANSAIGSVVVQLCRMLKLRAIAVVRPSGDFEKIATELKTFGASEARRCCLLAQARLLLCRWCWRSRES